MATLVDKKTTIAVFVEFNKPDNTFSQAILDYVTHHPKISHIFHINNTFLLNQTTPVEVSPDIFVVMIREELDKNKWQQNPNQDQWIEFYSLEKSATEVREFLNTIQENYILNVKNKLGNRRYFFNLIPQTATTNMDGMKEYISMAPTFRFTMKPFVTNRKFTNLFGENMEQIRRRVEFFHSNKEWYDEKGIPYTLGLLLSGPPGTGKTSTIKCLANECNRHIINIHLNNDITKGQMENLFFNENLTVFDAVANRTDTFRIPLDQRLYVLEDVDCQSDLTHARKYIDKELASASENPLLDRKKLNESLKMDLSFLLNLLDGVLENPGRMLIMTTNHASVLDSALVRPGRIDIISEFTYCSQRTIQQMLEFFYNIRLTGGEVEELRAFKDIFTPAQISKTMFENWEDYRRAINQWKNASIVFQSLRYSDESEPEPES